jgi:hypothetical protein
MYLALDSLPEAHVTRNKELVRFGMFTQDPQQLSPDTTTITAGVYNTGPNELAGNVKAGDIKKTIVHETGHAVDAEMGWTAGGVEPAKPERGGWKTYGTHTDAATDMVADSNAGIKTKLAPAQQTDVITEMTNVMGTRSATPLVGNVQGLAWFGALPNADKTAVAEDPALTAVGVGLNKPYFTREDGGVHLGAPTAHIYQESYTPTWVRYEVAARARKVSKYQFMDPGEWFAEAYEAYYRPDKGGRGAALVAAGDSNTKTYFDTDVHTRAPTR